MPNLQYIKCRQLRLDSYLLHIPFKMYLSPLDKKLPACNDIDISRINKVKNHAPCSIISEINIITWRKEVLSREIFFDKAGSLPIQMVDDKFTLHQKFLTSQVLLQQL